MPYSSEWWSKDYQKDWGIILESLSLSFSVSSSSQSLFIVVMLLPEIFRVSRKFCTFVIMNEAL